MAVRRGEPFYWIKSLDDITRILPDAPVMQPPPNVCSHCGGALELRWDMHSSGTDKEGRRRTWWIAWASCPACQLFFVQCNPPRSEEERGWRLEPDPPAFVRDPSWAANLKRAVSEGESNAWQIAAADRPRE
jgi:hypothetical protein